MTDDRTTPPSRPGVGFGPAPAAGDPCVLVIFGASGDLTKRLLMPALLNLASDRLLPDRFAVVGFGRADLTHDRFREKMTSEIGKFATRTPFDEPAWRGLVSRLYFTSGGYDDPGAYRRLASLVAELDARHRAGGNVVVYMATPPSLFGEISGNVRGSGLMGRAQGWTRLIVEKPFGHDLQSAVSLSRAMTAHWSEDQLYRIDHYLGKETVQNLLAFRFSNGIYEPLWNKNHIDQIQITVAETVTVEGRGEYYDRTGVVRDMIQNHLFQMLAYLCMEPPSSFRPDAIRNEKVKVLESIRGLSPEGVLRDVVRGQYGPGTSHDGRTIRGYREEPGVEPRSATETFAALRLFVDNWRWEGVPIYLRSGKALWKRGTEIVVVFRRAPDVMFRDTTGMRLESNKLIFHIQPDQGIELRFQAKVPGPSMSLQPVNMRFDYQDAFEAQRGTGYEVMLYSCMIGDATLFSRTDLVEASWRVAQPILDTWSETSPDDFPNYPAGSWGPKAAADLLARDGRSWVEVINENVLERVPILRGANPVFLRNLALTLKPSSFADGDEIIIQGDTGQEMYFLCRGQAAVVDGEKRVTTLGPGDFFGELALLYSTPRTVSVRALGSCEVFVLSTGDFVRLLDEQPSVAGSIQEIARARYGRIGDLSPAD